MTDSRIPATDLALLRLLQIASPNLPTGAFSYSQGLEWAVEAGWVTDSSSFTQWLQEQLNGTMMQQELPLLILLYKAYMNRDEAQALEHCSTAIALRETTELRNEERNRGRAMLALTSELNGEVANTAHSQSTCQLGVFAQYCAYEHISLDLALKGYAYSWLESQIMAAVKLVPLGQTTGQKILFTLSEEIPSVVAAAMTVKADDIGYANPAQIFASCQHETQYSRLFRS